jgi:putative oxidoreductase
LPDLQFAIETRESPMERFIRAVPRLALGVAFMSIGASKFGPHSSWVNLFNQLGAGDWFRYLAGTMQAGGGLLVLFRRTALIGSVSIACTMAGAVVADLFFLHFGIAAVIPLILLAFALGVALQAWAQ